MILSEKIKQKQDSLKRLKEQEAELVENILKQYVFVTSYETLKRSIVYGMRYILRKYYENYTVNTASDRPGVFYAWIPHTEEAVVVTTLSNLDGVVNYREMYKNYIANVYGNHYIDSLDKYIEKYGNLESARNFYGKRLIVLNHKKLEIKNLVFLFPKSVEYLL